MAARGVFALCGACMCARVTECEVDRVDDGTVLALGDQAVQVGPAAGDSIATGGSLSGRGSLVGRGFARLTG